MQGLPGCDFAPGKSLYYIAKDLEKRPHQDLCTTEALRHGEEQKINGFYSNLLIPGCIQHLNNSAASLRQKNEDTEVLILPRESGQ